MGKKHSWICKKAAFLFLFSCFMTIKSSYNGHAQEAQQPEVITSSASCLNLENIPIANLQHDLTKPLMGENAGWRITQKYNTLPPEQEPWPGARLFKTKKSAKVSREQTTAP